MLSLRPLMAFSRPASFLSQNRLGQTENRNHHHHAMILETW